jgi:hypothetical protein
MGEKKHEERENYTLRSFIISVRHVARICQKRNIYEVLVGNPKGISWNTYA